MTTVIYDGSKYDEIGVFMHSITENKLLKSGRIEGKNFDKGDFTFEFKSDDKLFPSKKVFVHDGLTEGKIFSRISPPVVTDDDFRIVEGGRDSVTGEMLITFYLDKFNIGKVFSSKDIAGKMVYESFRRDLEFEFSKFQALETI